MGKHASQNEIHLSIKYSNFETFPNGMEKKSSEKKRTRMHSSRMRTVRRNGCRGGGSAQGAGCLPAGCLPRGREYLPGVARLSMGGVCPGRGVCLGEVSTQRGGCLPKGGGQPSLPVDRILDTRL